MGTGHPWTVSGRPTLKVSAPSSAWQTTRHVRRWTPRRARSCPPDSLLVPSPPAATVRAGSAAVVVQCGQPRAGGTAGAARSVSQRRAGVPLGIGEPLSIISRTRGGQHRPSGPSELVPCAGGVDQGRLVGRVVASRGARLQPCPPGYGRGVLDRPVRRPTHVMRAAASSRRGGTTGSAARLEPAAGPAATDRGGSVRHTARGPPGGAILAIPVAEGARGRPPTSGSSGSTKSALSPARAGPPGGLSRTG